MEDWLSRIIKCMESKSMTFYELSKRTGISRTNFTRWKKGINAPNVDTLEKVCKVLGVSMSYIVNGFDDEVELELEHPKIPVLGVVPCGVPIEAIEDIVDYIDVKPERYLDHFGLIAKGDSMFPFICEKDVLIVKKTSEIKSNKIAIVKVNGDEATCKKVLINDNGITLVPLNNSYNPIFLSKEDIINKPVTIVGEVVEIRRNLNE